MYPGLPSLIFVTIMLCDDGQTQVNILLSVECVRARAGGGATSGCEEKAAPLLSRYFKYAL